MFNDRMGIGYEATSGAKGGSVLNVFPRGLLLQIAACLAILSCDGGGPSRPRQATPAPPSALPLTNPGAGTPGNPTSPGQFGGNIATEGGTLPKSPGSPVESPGSITPTPTPPPGGGAPGVIPTPPPVPILAVGLAPVPLNPAFDPLRSACAATLSVPARSSGAVALGPSTLLLGGKIQLANGIKTDLSTESVSWSTSASESATVDQQGRVTAGSGAGTAIISALTKGDLAGGGKASASCTIVVTAVGDVNVTLE